MELPKANIWKTTQPGKNKYAQILETGVIGTDKNVIVKKEERIVTDCAMELEMEENHNNKLRQKTTENALFWKQGDSFFGIIHGQLGSNVIAAAKNSINPDFVDTHNKRCIVSLLSILLSVCIKNISGINADLLYDGLQIILSTLSYTQ